MDENDKILNPRTNRYVTKGSTSYRRMIRQDIKEGKVSTPKVNDKPLKKIKSKSDSESEVDEKKKRKIRKELSSHSKQIIQNNEEQFRRVAGNQKDTEKLLKELLYKKLISDGQNHHQKKSQNLKRLSHYSDSSDSDQSSSSFSS